VYKVVIIDDEVLARVGIKSMINWEEVDCEISGDADNGESGLELIKSVKPDIVITDIKMPVMNGLQLIEKVKSEFKAIKFIVLSGYEEFNLVKQAMKLGAEEYLIKLDLDPQTLLTTVKTVCQKISEEMLDKNEQNKLQMHLNRNKQVLIEEFFKKLIGKLITSKNDLYDTLKYLSIELDESRLCIAVITTMNNKNSERYVKKEDIELFDFYVMNISEEISNDYFKSYIVRTEPGYYSIIFSSDENTDRKQFKDKVEKMCLRLIEMLYKYVGINISVGISNLHKNFFDLEKAYNEGVEASEHSFFVGLGKVIFYSDLLLNNDTKTTTNIQNYRNDMIKALELKNIGMLETIFDNISAVFKNGKINKGQAYDICYQIVYTISETVKSKNDILSGAIENDKSLYENVSKNSTLPEMIELMTNLKDAICSFLSQREDIDNNVRLVNAAKNYINENYTKDLTLNDVAAALNISHCYFSTLFKNIAGVNFVDFVTSVKVNHAKRLLAEGEYKIYEIARMLGYENAYYFSRVFKKVTGMTPSEYVLQNNSIDL